MQVHFNIRAMACLCLLSSFLTVQGQSGEDGMIYRFRLAPQGKMIDSATCFAWIPDHAGPLRSIIVHMHGCTREGDARQMMHDIQWRELARKWHAVLLAPAFNSGGNAQACTNWYNPDNGSDPVFLEMLDTLAARAGHPEISTVPWALWGHSGGSLWATAMTGKYPQRIAVTVAEACGFDVSGVEAALKVPVLHHNGVQDLCYNNGALFASGRSKGAYWSHAVNPVVESPMDGHQVHDLRFLAIPFMDACLAMRLPEQAGAATLREVDTSNAWLGDTTTLKVAAARDFKGNKLAACWFPNRSIAEKWEEYMASGEITDKTPPPAPYQVTGTFSGNAVTLRWKAAPDLESGLKTFIIYRDGKALQTLQYPTKTKYSKLTGYQRWNDGDQPAPIPPPEMIFTDTDVNGESRHTYEVSSVNWSGTVSKRSEKVTLKKGAVR